MDPKNTIALWMLAVATIITAFVRYQSWRIDKRRAEERQAEKTASIETDQDAH